MTTLTPRIAELTPSRPRAFIQSVGPLAIGLVAAVGLHLLLARYLGDFHKRVLVDIGINIVLAVSLNIVNGYTGQFSIGHAGFMAIGGYTAGAITYYASYHLLGSPDFHGGVLSWSQNIAEYEGPIFGRGDLLFVAACLAGGVLAALAGYVVGLPSLRLRGDYLAIVTLGFGEIVRVLFQVSNDQLYSLDEVQQATLREQATGLGGSLGLTGLPFYTSLFWTYGAVVVTLLVAYRLKASTQGRAFLAIRENEIAAAAMGVPVTKYKVRAFVLAAFFAGIAGGLFAHEVGSINAGELGFQKSFDIIIMVVLGGMGSISGAVVAAIGLTILPEWLREPTHVWPLGVAAVVVLLIVRRGRRSWTLLWVALATGAFEFMRHLALAHGVHLADYRMIFYALALIVIMILRPQGIFGLREVWDLGKG